MVSIPNILKFLAEEFLKGASYGTINNHRSAIAFILDPEVGQDDRIKKFCRGVSKKICLEKLTLKLVTLLALITGP